MNDKDWVDLANKLDAYKSFMWGYQKRLIVTFWSLFKAVLQYSFMLWIYLWVFDEFGIERTAIALAVGVILFGIRGKIAVDVGKSGR